MLFIILIAILVLGIILLSITDYSMIGGLLLYMGGLLVFISIMIVGLMYQKSGLTELQTEYLKLNCMKEYAMEHTININVSTDLMEDIQEYNKKVIFRQNHDDNFWIGIYIPNDRYDELETIDFNVTMQIK